LYVRASALHGASDAVSTRRVPLSRILHMGSCAHEHMSIRLCECCDVSRAVHGLAEDCSLVLLALRVMRGRGSCLRHRVSPYPALSEYIAIGVSLARYSEMIPIAHPDIRLGMWGMMGPKRCCTE